MKKKWINIACIFILFLLLLLLIIGIYIELIGIIFYLSILLLIIIIFYCLLYLVTSWLFNEFFLKMMDKQIRKMPKERLKKRRLVMQISFAIATSAIIFGFLIKPVLDYEKFISLIFSLTSGTLLLVIVLTSWRKAIKQIDRYLLTKKSQS